MPLTVRAKGVSLSTAVRRSELLSSSGVLMRPLQTNWAFNFLVGEMTPYLQEVIQWRLYPMHGFFCACSFIVGTCLVRPQYDDG